MNCNVFSQFARVTENSSSSKSTRDVRALKSGENVKIRKLGPSKTSPKLLPNPPKSSLERSKTRFDKHIVFVGQILAIFGFVLGRPGEPKAP